MENNNMDFTMKFEAQKENEFSEREVVEKVYKALTEKGYNPVNQLVGYFLSGWPKRITSSCIRSKPKRMPKRDKLSRYSIDS